MSAKEYIDQYGQLLGEVKDIEYQLSELCGEVSTEQTDAVTGSSTEIPYQKHSIMLHGYAQAPKTVMARKVLVEKYNAKLERLYAIIAEVEETLDGIDDVKARRIIRMRYLDGLEWQDIADRLNAGNEEENTEDSARKYATRYLERIS